MSIIERAKDKSSFAPYIRGKMKELDMRQADVSRVLDVRQPTVSNWLQGKSASYCARIGTITLLESCKKK